MVILRADCFLAFGTTTLRIPSLRLALTLSESTRTGKVKDRENSPMLRSETQYLASGALGSFLDPALPLWWATSVEVVFALAASSSSTVALWDSVFLLSPPSVMAPWDPPSTR